MILPIYPPGDAPATSTERRALEVRTYFREKNDLLVVYKAAALVDVVVADADVVPGTAYRAVDILLDLRRDGGGWPDFRGGGLERYNGPKVHATACALLALMRFPDVKEGTAWREATAWLIANLDPDVQSIATLAICHLALWTDAPAARHLSAKETAVRGACLRSILAWVGRTAPEDVRRTLEALEYLVPQRDEQAPMADHEFTFVLYSPHCLAALALIRSGVSLPRQVERFVIEVVWVIASRIQAHGSFVAAGRTLVSSVEHLWIYRLLYSFEQWRPNRRAFDGRRR